jgi:large subunit ribosomal protein L32
MAVPKKKLTRTRTGNRRSHLALSKIKLSKCDKCGEKKISHSVCEVCGTYKGDQIIDFTKKDIKYKDKK